LNTKEFIESGILESYVLGLATEEEQHEVNQRVLTSSGFADYKVIFLKTQFRLRQKSENLSSYVLLKLIFKKQEPILITISLSILKRKTISLTLK
jgi:hypothetical protein